MTSKKTPSRRRPDYVSEEMATALLDQPTYAFHDLFQTVYERLRARNATSGGEEMLRLRVYEKLQILVAQGIVSKDGKQYTANQTKLRARETQMNAPKGAKALGPARRGWTYHAE